VGLRVGIGLFTAQLPANSKRTFEQEYRETLELVRLAEGVGFDSAWVSEHHGSSDGYLPSLLAMLAAFAAVTERIELGTGVILTPLHDPLRLAEDAAVVDQLSGGRLLLGIGNGWREEEFRMFGTSKAERGARTEETVEVLRRAWTGRRFSFEGRALRYDRVKVTPATGETRRTADPARRLRPESGGPGRPARRRLRHGRDRSRRGTEQPRARGRRAQAASVATRTSCRSCCSRTRSRGATAIRGR
jgi:alkanesulfonate monooxygenase SsuD/methylene tetrahydromethanopterin reductase-like flavin-dependent oxidoreductase (luciferase family)